MARSTDQAGEAAQEAMVRHDPGGTILHPTGADVAVCDFCTVAWMGRDYHMSLYAMIPQVTFLNGFSDGTVGPGQVNVKQTYGETARVRLSTPAAIHIAGNLLSTMKEVDPSGFKQALKALKPLFDSDPQADEAE